MESIDRLLAELKAEYQASQKKAELKSQPAVQEAQAPLPPAVLRSNEAFKRADLNLHAVGADKDLAEIKAECEAQNKTQEAVSLEQQPAAKVAESQLDVQTHRQKVRQAQVWLKKLDKDSDERYWFDQFAFKYSSRIDAAIDYLQAVKEFD
jgi:hypothetical protein